MVAYTFAALFLAHVIADYLMQWSWLVANKRRPLALGIHITLVFLAMLLTTWTFSPWFLVLAAMHLAIDSLKTFVFPSGFVSYVADQALHVISIFAVAVLAPEIWTVSPLSGIPHLPLAFMLTAGILFATRGGQYAVAILMQNQGEPSPHGVILGWIERAALCTALIIGLPWAAAAVVGGKLAYLVPAMYARDGEARLRLLIGTTVSLLWGIATAVPLTLSMSLMQ